MGWDMASRSELQALRAQAMARHRAATRKVSRLNRRAGVSVSGSRVDPRSTPKNIRNYNATQLRSYINKLNKFVDRSVQFVPDANRQPISSATWKKYKSLERRYNDKIADHFSRYKDIFIGPANTTVGDRMKATTPDFPHMQDRAVNAPYTPLDRSSVNIGSERALKKLITDIRRRSSGKSINKRIRNDKSQFRELMKTVSDPSLVEKIEGLTTEQFDLLWNYSGFATAVSLGYEMSKALLSDNEKPWHSGVLKDSVNSAHELADWAKSVDLGK